MAAITKSRQILPLSSQDYRPGKGALPGRGGGAAGPEALALTVQLNKALAMPHGDVATVLRDGFGLQVNRSTICRAVDRVARAEKLRGTPCGADYGGCLIHDEWRIYYQFLRASYQTCNRHLIRRGEEMAEVASPTATRFPLQFKAVLEQGLALRDRYQNHEVSLNGLWTATGRLGP